MCAPRGIQESFGIMVNYLYDRDAIEDNHKAFVRGTIIAFPRGRRTARNLSHARRSQRGCRKAAKGNTTSQASGAALRRPRHVADIPTYP
jgi:hypothetical protein